MSSPFDYPAAVHRATEAASAYYNGANLRMTDAEYDELLDAIAAYEESNPTEVIPHALFDVAAGAATGDVPHPTPMLSLDKVRSPNELTTFLDIVAGAAPGQLDQLVSLTPKLDGMALRAVYRGGKLTQVVTRGNGQTGEDVTARLLRPQVTVAGLPRTVNASWDFEVRGEIVMSHEDYAFSNAARVATGKEPFVNPRNATAGTVRAETLDHNVRLTFVTYHHDDEPADFILATTLPGAGVFNAVEEASQLLQSVEDFGAARATYPYPTDGVVIAAEVPRVRKMLGETSRAPRWARAYKYEAQTAETVVRDIIVEVGRTGNLSFTAVFDPVEVDGSTIARASVHNTDLIAAKDIRIGSKAVVYKANDIIPQILSVTNDDSTTPWVAPTEDAEGFPYMRRGKFLVSTNPADSVSALLTYAASRDVLDIDTLGRSVADALVESGLVTDLSDLFTLREADLAGMPFGESTYGPTRANTLVANIEEARKQPLARFITALGIRLTGRTFGRRLAAAFGSFEALLAATESELLTVEGVGPERVAVIHAGLQANRDVIGRLREAGVDPTVEVATGGALNGLTVVVTGSTKGTALEQFGRNEMNELIEAHGGKASSSVSKNTGLLVAGDGAGSKLAKATELGVRVVSPDEFAQLVGLG